jgi:hypothetical protein
MGFSHNNSRELDNSTVGQVSERDLKFG